MKKKTKEILTAIAVILFLFSAVTLASIFTAETIESWTIPTGIVCGLYMVGFGIYEFHKVINGEW